MNIIEWDANKHAVNILSFDDDHKKIFKLLNDLFDKMSSGHGAEIISSLLKELKEYGVKHFKAEEELMEKYFYPETDIHKKEHNDFKEKVNSLSARFDAGDKLLTVESFFFLKDWVNKHVMDTDQRYVDFFHNKGIH